MNARESYNLTLQGIEALKKKQLIDANKSIEIMAGSGAFSIVIEGKVYDETRKDLTSRGFKVGEQQGSYTQVSWAPKPEF
jgi:hypothetical protein